MVLPQLSDSSEASSPASCSMRSASLKSRRPRSAASIVLQGPVSRACAGSLDGLVDVGRAAGGDLGDHLAGRRVVRLELPPSTGSTHLLSMNSLVSFTLGLAGADATFAGIVNPRHRWGGIVPRVGTESSGAREPKSIPRPDHTVGPQARCHQKGHLVGGNAAMCVAIDAASAGPIWRVERALMQRSSTHRSINKKGRWNRYRWCDHKASQVGRSTEPLSRRRRTQPLPKSVARPIPSKAIEPALGNAARQQNPGKPHSGPENRNP